MTLQIIKKDGHRFVQIPFGVYEKLTQDAEMLADIAAYDTAMTAWEKSGRRGIPLTLLERVWGGESALLVWREYRDFTQTSLAEASGVNRSLINQIESGAKSGSVGTLRKLAQALDCTVDDLLSD